MGQNQKSFRRSSDEISERPPLPSSPCHPRLPSPLPAQVQWRSLILFQQQWQLSLSQQSQGYSCGRRKRQANFGGSQASGGQELDGEERFFLPTGQGCTCNTNGRKKRQAPGEDEPGTRFFGGLFGGTPHCGNCCYNTQPFNNNGFNSNFQ